MNKRTKKELWTPWLNIDLVRHPGNNYRLIGWLCKVTKTSVRCLIKSKKGGYQEWLAWGKYWMLDQHLLTGLPRSNKTSISLSLYIYIIIYNKWHCIFCPCKSTNNYDHMTQRLLASPISTVYLLILLQEIMIFENVIFIHLSIHDLITKCNRLGYKAE